MISETWVASKYARAAFEIAQARGKARQVLDDLIVAAEVLGQGDGRVLLSHPLIPVAQKMQAIHNLLGGTFQAETIRLLELLAAKGRGGLLQAVTAAFQDAWDQSSRRETAKVHLAVPLSSEQLRLLQERLSALAGKTVEIESMVDPRILAGIRVEMRDWRLDGTLAGRLERLRRAWAADN